MSLVSSENAVFQQRLAEANAHLIAQIRHDIAALRQLVIESDQQIQAAQRERAALLDPAGMMYVQIPLSEQAAGQ